MPAKIRNRKKATKSVPKKRQPAARGRKVTRRRIPRTVSTVSKTHAPASIPTRPATSAKVGATTYSTGRPDSMGVRVTYLVGSLGMTATNVPETLEELAYPMGDVGPAQPSTVYPLVYAAMGTEASSVGYSALAFTSYGLVPAGARFAPRPWLPLKNSTAPLLNEMSARYSQFRYKSATWHYEPIVSSLTNGSFVLAQQDNPASDALVPYTDTSYSGGEWHVVQPVTPTFVASMAGATTFPVGQRSHGSFRVSRELKYTYDPDSPDIQAPTEKTDIAPFLRNLVAGRVNLQYMGESPTFSWPWNLSTIAPRGNLYVTVDIEYHGYVPTLTTLPSPASLTTTKPSVLIAGCALDSKWEGPALPTRLVGGPDSYPDNPYGSWVWSGQAPRVQEPHIMNSYGLVSGVGRIRVASTAGVTDASKRRSGPNTTKERDTVATSTSAGQTAPPSSTATVAACQPVGGDTASVSGPTPLDPVPSSTTAALPLPAPPTRGSAGTAPHHSVHAAARTPSGPRAPHTPTASTPSAAASEAPRADTGPSAESGPGNPTRDSDDLYDYVRVPRKVVGQSGATN